MNSLEDYLFLINDVKVIDSLINYSDYFPIDLSVSSTALAMIDLKNTSDFEVFIQNQMQNNNAKVAYGGYLEKRNLYKRSILFNNDEIEERNIHIGMDLWVEARTSVLAALDGKIHSFANNIGLGNYGPTILLEHSLENHVFYTLYGHLSKESIENIAVGTRFKKGDQIATLGDSTVNGGYSPHLHFQIIKEISTYKGDYPGVCSNKNLGFYAINCPDPNILLKI